MDLVPIIPNYSLKDTVALLMVLLALPPTFSGALLTLYTLASMGTRWAVSLTSRLLLNGNPHAMSTVTTASYKQQQTEQVQQVQQQHQQHQQHHNQQHQQEDKHSGNNLSAFVLIILSDVFLCIVLKLTGPLMTKVALVLSKAILSASLCGGDWISVMLATFIALASDKLFGLISLYTLQQFGFSITSQHSLFPHLSTSNSHLFQFFSSLFSSYAHWQQKYFQFYSYNTYRELFHLCFKFLIDVLNLMLSIHIILISFTSIFKNNFFSRSINQFALLHSDLHIQTIHPVLVKDRTREFKIISVELSQEQADTKLVLWDENDYSMETPASYPETEPSDALSSRNIVAGNFIVFCSAIFSRAKSSLKSIQPIWCFVATLKAMSLRKDIYSGEVEANKGGDNSLILSDYVNKYDDYVFANFDQCFKRNRILIFVDYIGETLISFQLKNYNHGDIIIRVNGIIWYQVSRGDHNDEEYFIVGGLTPLSQYDVQFIIEEKDEFGNKKKYLIGDLIVSTIDKDGNNISTAKSTSSKVLSPLVTLQESLITTTDNLNQEKVKLKKQRKEISKKLNSYKQEIDKLKSRISSSDNNDLKNWNKVSLLRTSVKQAEEDVSKVENELAQVETQETEVYEVYIVEKRKYEQQLRNFQNFKNTYNGKVDTKRTRLSDLNVDLDNLTSKRDRLQNKADKFSAELSKVEKELDSLYKSDLTARITSRQIRNDKRKGLLAEFTKEIEKMQTGCTKLEEENAKLMKRLLSSSL